MAAQQIILLVEDNADDEVLTLRAIRKSELGSTVVVVRDGAECIDYLHGSVELPSAEPLPSLVLLDLNLPKLGGLDVLVRLRAHERTKLLPVVVLTSSQEEADILASYSRGANAYIRKPVDFSAFNDVMKAVGIFWLVVNLPAPTWRAS